MKQTTMELGYYRDGDSGETQIRCTSLDQPHLVNARYAQKLADEIQAVVFIRDLKTKRVHATYTPYPAY
jgi:hypothetical protein